MANQLGITFLMLVAVALVVGPVAPIDVLYATSGSMEPTIGDGDLYFAVESTDIQRGDIIVFESPRYAQDVTHRVVGQSADGFITKGDANPSTDQVAGHPPISESAVSGKVVEVNGQPLIIPGLGPILEILHAHRGLASAVAVVLFGIVVARSVFAGQADVPKRDVTQVGDILAPMIIGALLVSFIFLFWGMSTHEITYVATAGDPSGKHTIPIGDQVTQTFQLETYTPPLTTVLVDADGMQILEYAATQSSTELTVRIPAQETAGPHLTRVHVYAFPAILPQGVLASLLSVHWLLAALASIAPIFLPILGTYLLMADPKAPLRAPRNRWLTRLRRS